MSLNPLDLYAAPGPDYSEDEWEAARKALWAERRQLGWTDEQIASGVDDYLIAEKCDAMRDDLRHVQADEERARRKESW